MLTAVCIALFALGHLVRDGWPPFKDNLLRIGAPAWVVSLSTQFARVTGALICGIGVIFVAAEPVKASLLIAAAVLAGFYTDMKHGEGQQARGWSDAAYLLLSGVTSVAPLAALWAVTVGDAWAALIVLPLGLSKPFIWFAAWRVVPVRPGLWLSPTRAAAMAFGAAIGAFVAW